MQDIADGTKTKQEVLNTFLAEMQDINSELFEKRSKMQDKFMQLIKH